MKLRAFVVLACLLQACAEERPGGASQADGSFLPDTGPPASLPDASPPASLPDAAPGGEDTCAAGGQFDFQMSGANMSAWEGRRVVAAAIENDIDVSPTVSTRVVLLSGKIQDGAFSLLCPQSLHENYGYPSWAVFVDVDGDGHCSAGDVGYQAQLFGWSSSVAEALVAAYASPTASLAAPTGSSASSFCAGYFQ
jgi:hypothetical protein